MTDDDLDRLLTPRGESDARLKAAILAETSRLIRRRRWAGSATKALLGAGLFLSGLGVGWSAKPSPSPAPPPAVAPPEVIAVPVLVLPPSPPPAEPYQSADRIELIAEQADDRAEAARLYRLAGDKYLTDAGEPGQAARCYRLHLQHAGPAGLAVESADSWLLTSLKTQRLAEVRDAGVSGL